MKATRKKFWKYALGTVTDGEEDGDGPNISPLQDTSFFLSKVLTKGTSIAILNKSIEKYGQDLENCNNSIFHAVDPNPLTKLYVAKYKELDFNTNTLQEDDQDSISVGSFYPLTKEDRKTLLDNEKARTTDEMVNQPVQHRVGIITKSKKNYNIWSQYQVLQILSNIISLLLQASGVKITDGILNTTYMGSLAILTIEIVKILNKSSIKKWFNDMKKNYPFLAINIVDTFNQGWINWIKASLELAYSKDTPILKPPLLNSNMPSRF